MEFVFQVATARAVTLRIVGRSYTLEPGQIVFDPYLLHHARRRGVRFTFAR